MNTVDYLLEKNYKHINIFDSDLYINEEGTVYRYNKSYKKITLCSDNKPNNRGYKKIQLINNEGKTKQFRLHRLVYLAFNSDWDIFNTSTDNFIDHINGNKTDNTIFNLRNVTHQHNQFNNTKCKGYSYHKQHKKYGASIRLNGKLIHLGYFDNEQEARQEYLKSKEKYHKIIEL